jgi:hypothetical protein
MTSCRSSGSPDERLIEARNRTTKSSGPTAGLIVEGQGFVGVIFPAEPKPIPGIYPPTTSYWTPSKSDVLAAEERLVPFLKNSTDPNIPAILKNLETYKRQYRGLMSDGKKQIVIHFFCRTYEQDWHIEEIVNDDGSCYFNVLFSTEMGAFSDLEINGIA